LRGLGPVGGQPEAVETVAFSPDGQLLAAGDIAHTPPAVPYRYGTIAVWDTQTGKLVWKLRTKAGAVTTVAFSPDGSMLAVGRESGTITVYDSRTGRPGKILHLEAKSSPQTLAFAPSGELASGDWNGIVNLWNPKTGEVIGHRALVAAAPVASLSFNPAGTTFATAGGSDGLAKLWSTATEQQFGSTFPGDPGQWGNAQYTPDGSRLLVVYQDGKGFVWPTSSGAWERHACAVAGRNLTREEWQRYVPHHSYARVCS
jgi:DNA-binding beta-propeller fold protein YncE